MCVPLIDTYERVLRLQDVMEDASLTPRGGSPSTMPSIGDAACRVKSPGSQSNRDGTGLGMGVL